MVVNIHLIGLEEALIPLLGNTFKNCHVSKQAFEAEALMNEPLSPAPQIVLCGSQTADVSPMEAAQVLRMQNPDVQVYFVTSSRAGFDRKVLKKNGFNDAFLLPSDIKILAVDMKDRISEFSQGEIKSYRSVRLIDVKPESKLDFDVHVFLPANNKYVKVVGSGRKLDEKRAEKLSKHAVGSVYVESSQMQSFYKFAAEQLKNINTGGNMSETERQQKRQQAVRDLLGRLFNDPLGSEDSLASGRQMVQDCQEIIKSYVLSGNLEKNSWYEKLMTMTGNESNAYSHAANVSTWAAFFSIGLGIGNPEELAIAGLLLDIGMADIPLEIQTKDPSLWTPEEKKIYESHPQKAIDMIKERKMNVSENIQKFILQHHENYSGNGYPHQLPGPKIAPEAQILALADTFDDLMIVKPGQPQLPPYEVLKKMVNDSLKDLSHCRFNPQMARKLLALFAPPEKKSA